MTQDSNIDSLLVKTVGIVLCVLFLTIGACTMHRNKLFAENGYEDTVLPGCSTGNHWRKAETKTVIKNER